GTMDRFGVSPLLADVGDPFVAARHESVGSADSSDLPENSVAEIVQPGWILDAQSPKPVVLRRATVKLAKHGPKVPTPRPAAEAKAEAESKAAEAKAEAESKAAEAKAKAEAEAAEAKVPPSA
ncbi:unnamed protein product, partial [Polarella glacialis]